MDYIKSGQSFKVNQSIPGSSSGDSVTIKVRRNSDGFYWNFSTEAFQSGSASGTMTYDYEEFWNASFTPATADDAHNITITSAASIDYYQTLISVGTATATATTGDDLTTRANVKEFIDGKTDTNDDALIDNLIVRMSKEIKTFCRWEIVDDDRTEYYDGDGTDTLLLDQLEVNSIASLYDDSDRAFGSSTEITSSDYIFTASSKMAKQGILKLDGLNFTEGVQNIKITYNAGYATIPPDVEEACILLVFAELMGAKQSVDVQVEGQEDSPTKSRKRAYKLLGPYKRFV